MTNNEDNIYIKEFVEVLENPRLFLSAYIDAKASDMKVAPSFLVNFNHTKFKNVATCLGALRTLLKQKYPNGEFHMKVNQDNVIEVWRLK
jgi:hypothetical protein